MNVETLFFKFPLYQEQELNDNNKKLFTDLFFDETFFHGYNSEIKENTTFEILRNKYERGVFNPYRANTGYHQFQLRCVRTDIIYTYFFLLVEREDNKQEARFFLSKIGQFPSIADLEFSKFDKYKKTLKPEDLRELKKAVGLSANGIGIGAFVYLRRVFENLIEEKHQEIINLSTWDEEKYKYSKVDEKILLLKDKLPLLMVEYRKVYSIISKGIHELSEQECLEYFNVVLDAITLILEEEFKINEEIKRKVEMEENINKIHLNLKNKI